MEDSGSNRIIINDREQLKKYFRGGALPKENHFVILIDSMFNKVDDGINKTDEDGLMIFPAGDEEKLLSFYDSLKEKNSSWVIANHHGETKGLILREGETENPTIYFQKQGNIGIGTLNPGFKLAVNGLVSTHGRVGDFAKGQVPADGKWHDVITGLTGCVGFELMAYAGKKQQGKYALLHATALSTFGKSKPKIRKTCAHYGFWWNKITCRWVGDTFDYGLQIKTISNYGDDCQIYFRLSKLWDDEFLKDF
ncbi:adhesin [Algoriphagus aestuarii]|nr:adhesin [Algoriphagus aestuarii]